MAASGYTPIQIYHSSTSAAVPSAGSLVAGELAINTADGYLFYKDSGGSVQIIASKAGNINVSSFSGGTTGLLPSSTTTGAITLSGTLNVANGGSGQTTAQLAMNAFAGAVTSGYYLRGNGTNVSMSALQLADLPTVTIAKGGTGLTSFTAGDLIYYSTSTSFTKLGIGTAGQVLTVNSGATAPQWSNASGGGGVTTISFGTTGLTPSTATSGAVTVAGTLAVANGGTGVTTKTGTGSVVLSSSPTLVTPALGAATATTINTLTIGIGPGTGISSTAVGVSAFASNTTGSFNTAFGNQALTAATNGDHNTAIGAEALLTMGTNFGSSCTAVGSRALKFNVQGSYNTALGYVSGTNATSPNGTFVGAISGFGVTSGTDNTHVGVLSGSQSTGTGNFNTSIGSSSLTNLTTGANNISVGYQSGADAVQNITTSSNLIVMGNNSHTAAYIKVSWTVTSDARDKTSFAPVPLGLDFICSLTPVAYQFKASRADETPIGPVRYGFKAQDILAAEGANPVIIDNSDPENLKYNQDSMIAALTNAIKELKAEIETLKAK